MIDLLDSLPDGDALETHFAVERRTLDERPLARRLFEKVTAGTAERLGAVPQHASERLSAAFSPESGVPDFAE